MPAGSTTPFELVLVGGASGDGGPWGSAAPNTDATGGAAGEDHEDAPAAQPTPARAVDMGAQTGLSLGRPARASAAACDQCCCELMLAEAPVEGVRAAEQLTVIWLVSPACALTAMLRCVCYFSADRGLASCPCFSSVCGAPGLNVMLMSFAG
eukprot:1159203-Pelagomonas_calceolata.AAC.3